MARINAVSFHQEPSIERICRIVREAGFDSLEVSRPPFFEKLLTRGTRRTFAGWAKKLGLELYGFDCWVEVDPYRAREDTLQGFRRAIEFAADLDLGMVITHDPWASVNAGRSPQECLRVNVDLFREVAGWAAEKDLRLVFEPHPDTLSMDDAWAIDFIDGIGRENAGLLFDFCHYGVGQREGYVGAIGRLGKRIQHLHLSDGDRRTYALHLPLGEGELDLEAMVEALKSIGYGGTLTNDLFNYPLLEDGARRNVERVRQVERELGI
jgi:sugar phosphate isomerase/epimerase